MSNQEQYEMYDRNITKGKTDMKDIMTLIHI